MGLLDVRMEVQGWIRFWLWWLEGEKQEITAKGNGIMNKVA
jgi:hypothetical protein